MWLFRIMYGLHTCQCFEGFFVTLRFRKKTCGGFHTHACAHVYTHTHTHTHTRIHTHSHTKSCFLSTFHPSLIPNYFTHLLSLSFSPPSLALSSYLSLSLPLSPLLLSLSD